MNENVLYRPVFLRSSDSPNDQKPVIRDALKIEEIMRQVKRFF